jgi:hypothetical protein
MIVPCWNCAATARETTFPRGSSCLERRICCECLSEVELNERIARNFRVRRLLLGRPPRQRKVWTTPLFAPLQPRLFHDA